MNTTLKRGLRAVPAVALGSMISLVSTPARAELPFTAVALASIQATLDHCAAVDKGRAEWYQKYIEVFTKGVPAGDVLGVKNTDGYKDTYKATREKLAQSSDEDSLSACHQIVPDLPPK